MLGQKKTKQQQKKPSKNIDLSKKNKKVKNASPIKIKTTPQKKKAKRQQLNTDRQKQLYPMTDRPNKDIYKSKDKQIKNKKNHMNMHVHQMSNNTQYTQGKVLRNSPMLRTSPIVFNKSKSKDRSVSIKIYTNRSHYQNNNNNNRDKDNKNINRQLFKQNKQNIKNRSNQKSKSKSKDKSRSRLKTERDISPLKQTKVSKQFNVADRQIKYNRQQSQQLKKVLKKKMKQKKKHQIQLEQYNVNQFNRMAQFNSNIQKQRVQYSKQGYNQERKSKLRKKIPQIKTQFSERRSSYFDQILLKKYQINKNQQKISELFNPFQNHNISMSDRSQHTSNSSINKNHNHNKNHDENHNQSSFQNVTQIQLFKRQQQSKLLQFLQQLTNVRHEVHDTTKIDNIIQHFNSIFAGQYQYQQKRDDNVHVKSNLSTQSKEIEKMFIKGKYQSQNKEDIQKDSFKKKFQSQNDDNQQLNHQQNQYTNYNTKFVINLNRNDSKDDQDKFIQIQDDFEDNDNALQNNMQNKQSMKLQQLNIQKLFKRQQLKVQIPNNTKLIKFNTFKQNNEQQANNNIAQHNKITQQTIQKQHIQPNNIQQIPSPVKIDMHEQQQITFVRSNYISLSDFYDKKNNAIISQISYHKNMISAPQLIIQQIPLQQQHHQSWANLHQQLTNNNQITSINTRLTQQFNNQMQQLNIFNQTSSESMLLTHQDPTKNSKLLSQIQHILIIQFCTNILRSRSILHNFLTTYSQMVDNNAINVNLIQDHPPVKLAYSTNQDIISLFNKLIKYIQDNYKQNFMRQIKTSFVCRPIDILKLMRSNDDQQFQRSSISQLEPQAPYFNIDKIEQFQTIVLKNQFFIPNYFSFNHAIYDCFNDIFEEMRPFGIRGKAIFSLQISTPYTDFKQVKKEIVNKFGKNIEQKYTDEKLVDDFERSASDGIFQLVYYIGQEIMLQIFEGESQKIMRVINKRSLISYL